MEQGEDDFDPIGEQTLRDPHAAYVRLRRTCPLAHGSRWGGFWVVSRYKDVIEVTRDHETFVNSVQNVVPAVTTSGRRPPLHFDPPEHTRWRKAMSGPFKTSTLASLERSVRTLVSERFAPLLSRGRCELVSEFAASVPVQALCIFLNAEGRDEEIKNLSERFLRAFHGRDHEALERESRNLYAVAKDILELRRRQPLDPTTDLASALLAMRVNGEPVSDDLMQGALRQLLVAGHVATTMAMGSAARHLALHPELQERMRREPQLVPAAVEELLRLYTPNQAFCRTANRRVELHGQAIDPGEPIVVLYPSANRDEDVFESPDEFVLDRPVKHVAFGNGIHKCPGEALARLQLRVFVQELLARTSSFELDGPVEFARWPEFGPSSLPLRLNTA